MNHDYEHCADFRGDCPQECFRAKLVRDLGMRSDLIAKPVSWMHFKGGIECPKTRKEGADG